MRRVFGRSYIADARDYRIKTVPADRRSRTWRLGPVTDQLNTPHCVGHAWSNWFRSTPLSQNPISPRGIYSLAQHFDEWEGELYDGTSIRGAAKALSLSEHISEYRWAWDITNLANHVLSTSPVVIGVNWYAGMNRPDSKGFINVTGRLQGGHAVLVYGISMMSASAKIRNSWGAGWGVNGSCLISFDDLDRLIKEDGEVCTAVEAGTQG